MYATYFYKCSIWITFPTFCTFLSFSCFNTMMSRDGTKTFLLICEQCVRSERFCSSQHKLRVQGRLMVMSVLEIVIISAGLSLDVFVAMAYMGAGFSKIRWKNLILLSILFGGIQLGTLVLGNLITLLPLLSITRTKTAADRWEGLTVLILLQSESI